MIIAIIPARGGSKRIPRKNLKPFLGKPIIAYSIETALESGCFDKVIVSTDDAEIAAIAAEYGAEVPYLRGAEISDDVTPIKDVIRDALNWCSKNQINVSHICCVYATAPFTEAEDIRMGLRLLNENESANFSIAVSPFSYPIQRSLRLADSGFMSMNNPEHMFTRSQDLPEMYHDAAQFFWAHRDAIMKYDTIFDSNCCPVVIPPYRVQDLDTDDDWIEAELKYKLIAQLDGD